MRHIVRKISVVAVIGSLCGFHAEATVVVPAELGELAREARAIALGRVTAVDGRWTDDRRAIETIVTLEVEQYLKGALGATLQFRVPGGELGRFRSIVVGAPELRTDERVIVFLGANGPMVPFVLGFNQGLYRVIAANGGYLVTPPALLPAAAGTVAVVRGDRTRQPLLLDQFTQQVRALSGAAR